MSRTWLVLDANYLCHRAYHALGALKDGGDTAAIFGFMRDIRSLQDDHNTQDIVFCFDCGKGLRELRSAGYKQSRRDKYATAPQQEQDSISKFRNEVVRLREKYLRTIGYRNIYFAEGYEADDCIASFVRYSMPPTDTALIISTDHDMYQLLRPNVLLYNPAKQKPYTHICYHQEWKIPVRLWPKVKALAGCSSDDVLGIPGIGEKTAAAYYAGTLPEHHQVHAKIVAEEQDYLTQNLPLVQLPYPGTPVFPIAEDCVTSEKWNYVANRLGFNSLLGRCPVRSVQPDKPTFGVC